MTAGATGGDVSGAATAGPAGGARRGVAGAPDAGAASRWVAERTPVAPHALTARVAAALAAADPAPGPGAVAETCLRAGTALLARLVADGAAGTRSRHAALDLLTADALVTYAFEAASDDPESLPAFARAAIDLLAGVDGAPAGQRGAAGAAAATAASR